MATPTWQALASAHVFPSFALPAPSSVWQAFTTLISSGYLGSTLQQDLIVSLVRVSTAFVAGVAIRIAMKKADTVLVAPPASVGAFVNPTYTKSDA